MQAIVWKTFYLIFFMDGNVCDLGEIFNLGSSCGQSVSW